MDTNTRWWIVIILATLVSAWVVIVQPLTTGRGKEPFKLGLDLKGGVRVVLRAQTEKLPPEKQREWKPENMASVVDIVERRVNRLGVTESVVARQGLDRILVELPGVVDEKEALRLIQTTAQLEFWYLPSVQSERNPMARYRLESRTENGREITTVYDTVQQKEVDIVEFLQDQKQRAAEMGEQNPVVTGADLKPVCSIVHDQMGRPEVSFEFNAEGARRFGDFTRRHVGEILAIVLDNRIISAPRVEEAILGGKGVIRGNFSAVEAAELATLLNSGALPVPLEVIQITKVGATLGKESVRQSLWAGVVGLGLVLLFMVGYYLLPGVLASLALGLYTLYSLAAYKLLGVVFTVPGIAGFILSIGMAVDANILIFERMKEELRSGKTLKAAIDDGFKRAFTAIFDSNVCTIITSIVLFSLGTGAVKGFALMLMIGVAISMFTAITVTRTMLWTLVSMGIGNEPRLFGLSRQWTVHYDIVGKRNLWFAISGTFIAIGVIAWAIGGLKLGVDFAGGSELQLQFDKPVTARQIQTALAQAGFRDAKAVVGEGNLVFIRTREISAEEKEAIKSALASLGTPVERSFTQVGGIVSKEQTRNAVIAIILSEALILLYLAVRFAIGGIREGFKFGVAAVIALVHDVLVLVGTFSIMGKLRNWEVDALFVTAMLTLIGFSVHDTIVVFDRIRENLRNRARGETFHDVANKSILQTFARSINTSLTVILTLVALLVLGSPVVRLFTIALLVGIITGTYSSIFNAAPIVTWWEEVAERRGLRPATPHITPAQPSETVVKRDGAPEAGVASSATSSKPRPKRRRRA
ncbi:MAG: protein translocase subunit SecDF [Armatimonadota bacterium]|nr:MAG: protein translocase subunit SecDF [Armatimonadota bacterium]